MFKSNKANSRRRIRMTDGQNSGETKLSIPNGNMFYSKNPDLILPNYWPTYFGAKGRYVWDQKIKNIQIFQ